METPIHRAPLTEDEVASIIQKMRQSKLIKDRTYHLKKYPKCFIGSEAVTFFLTTDFCNNIEDAISLGERLMKEDHIHHVLDEHTFKNENLYYRFRVDDTTYVGPSVAKLLCSGEVTVHSELEIQGTFFYSKKYACLHAEKKKIYYFSTNLSSEPSGIIDLTQGALETAECECKSGSYCFTISDGASNKWVLCAFNSKTQTAWLEALSAIGIQFREEEFTTVKEASIFDFTANDIDGNVVTLDKYRGNVCIVVNVASY